MQVSVIIVFGMYFLIVTENILTAVYMNFFLTLHSRAWL
jgi:hypothetical protein